MNTPMQRTPHWRTVMPFLVGLTTFALLAALNHARGFDLWRNYALSGLGLGGITTWVVYHYDVRVPHYIQWVIVVGLWLHYGGGSLGSPDPYHMGLFGYHGINGAYHVHSWWDNLTHFMGIGAGTMAIAYLLEAYQVRRALAWRRSVVFALAVTVGLATGVGVELYEYLGKAVFQTIDQGGYSNTMMDLHFNILGAVVGGALAVTIDRRRLAGEIASHWASQSPTKAGQPVVQRLPAPMAGFLAFVLPAAVTTLALAARFAIESTPLDEGHSYDSALQILLASAIVGVLMGPLVGLAWRRVQGVVSQA